MSEERRAFVVMGTASDSGGPVHCRAWEVPCDEDAMGQLAATMTEAYGPPHEWVSDETSGQHAVVFFRAEHA